VEKPVLNLAPYFANDDIDHTHCRRSLHMMTRVYWPQYWNIGLSTEAFNVEIEAKSLTRRPSRSQSFSLRQRPEGQGRGQCYEVEAKMLSSGLTKV